jgi:hypothetical protein
METDNPKTLIDVVELALYVFEKGLCGLLPQQNPNNNSDKLLVVRLFARI